MWEIGFYRTNPAHNCLVAVCYSRKELEDFFTTRANESWAGEGEFTVEYISIGTETNN